ncbi:MAG: 3-deoxy-manno-octulosonate cytidylyltransferase [Phycisphaerae bacterium]|nr:3-deoxy-manno-octulosonate cytidylyltransferase [Phycisphaerae bacterium]
MQPRESTANSHADMHVLAVIPARYASTRYPGKPLLAETGKYLIQHVYERVRRAARVRECLVATDDARIADASRSFGGAAEMTRDDHVSGTDRIAEVVARRRSGGGAGRRLSDDDLILNVQGDEPELEPEYLDRLVRRMESDTAPCGTLACPFPSDADPADPNAVKVVLDRSGRALYFSRALIPYVRDVQDAARHRDVVLLHLGVYAYRVRFLLELAAGEPTTLERIEKLEQLRVLETGHTMAVEVVPSACVGIDTPQDYQQFVRRWRAASHESEAGAAPRAGRA